MTSAKTQDTAPQTYPLDLTTDLPAMYLQHPVASFPSEWQALARDWWSSCRWSLYVYSSANGTGKSCFAGSLIRAHRESLSRKGVLWPYYLPAHRGGMWMSMPRYIPIIRDLDRWPHHRDRLARSELVVVDDLAAGRNTPHIVEEMVLMLMRRFEDGRRTILTSNLSLKDVADVLDRRLASRLQDGMILQAGKSDLRGRGSATIGS